MKGTTVQSAFNTGVSRLAVALSAGVIATAASAQTQPTAPTPAAEQNSPATTATAEDTAAATAAVQDAPAATTEATDPGLADEGAAPPAADIIVTGSRVARAGFNAPTPTTVIAGDTLAVQSPRTIVETLAFLPAFRGTATPGSGGGTIAGSGGGGYLNMRGLGATRTLLLLDRQRMVPVAPDGTVDVSLLPTNLLSGIDVVTGGASAAWGSDAVAGVVNFRLDSRFRGLSLSAENGISRYGDGHNYKLGGRFGVAIGEAFHIVGTVEHERNLGVTSRNAKSRSFGLSDYQTVANPSAPPATGIFPHVYDLATFGGLIVGGPLNFREVLPDATLGTYTPCGPITGNNITCPGVRPDLPFVAYFAQLYAPLKRTSGFVRASYDVSSDVTIYADALAGKSNTTYFTVPATSSILGAFVTQRDNAYLPAQLGAAMDAAGVTSVNIRRYSRDQGPFVANRQSGIMRGSVGVNAKLGDGWKADAYAAYGESTFDTDLDNITITQRFRNAVDSVRVNGNPVCRINADAITTNDDPACRPLNYFGDGALASTPDAVNYYAGTAFSHTRTKQFSAAANVSGEPFSTWAGPVSLAAGAEYRAYSLRTNVDALSASRSFFAVNFQPLSGSVKVKEAFAELVVPLAKDMPFADNLDVSAAGRITDYSVSGTVATWKLGLNYSPLPGIRFRGTWSRDIRAPYINELFSGLVQTNAAVQVIDRRDGTVVQIRTLTVGNSALKPEIAVTKSAGVVFQPAFFPGFQASADYFNITADGAISAPPAQQVIDACAGGDTSFCSQIYRNDVAGGSVGALTRVDSLFVNLSELRTSGIDFELGYRRPLAGGTINARAIATYLINFKSQNLTTAVDSTATQLNPRWAGDGTLSYEKDGTAAFLGATYRGGGRINPNFSETGFANNRTSSVTYINTAISQDIAYRGSRLNLRFSISNLFDVKPPYGYPLLANGDTYDRVGRFYKLAVRLDL